ncbi:MAG: family 20 glycosylhydrolase [Planctomycetes bacterium]|nr:family 20 glycosylhydrolase [Planctomycetota bacterium]
MKRIRPLSTILAAAIGTLLCVAHAGEPPLPLVPYPKSVVVREGRFPITKDTRIVVGTNIPEADANGAAILNEDIERMLGGRLRIERSGTMSKESVIIFDGFGAYPIIAKACEERRFAIPKDLPPEGYFISIRGDGVFIGAKDRRGMVCAALTLGQLMVKRNGSIEVPCCDIVDFPSLAMRICHMQVPAYTVQGWNLFERRAEQKPEMYQNFKTMNDYLPLLEHMTRMALRYKMNGILIDLCNVFRFTSCPDMALPQAMPVAGLKPIIELTRKYYAEPIPQLNLLSHQEHFLAKARPDLMLVKLAQYPKKRVARYDDFFYWEPVYDPNNSEVRKIVAGVIDETIDLFRPTILHIGHDECGALGFVPRKKDREITALFAGSVRFLHDYLKRRNVRTMMWGDMLLNQRQFPTGSAHGAHPGAPTWPAAKDIPKDVIIADWQYYPFVRPYPDTGGPRADFPSSLYFSDNGFAVVGAVLGKLAITKKHIDRWRRHRAHNQNFSRYVAGLNPDGKPDKGIGLGMIVSHWYLNPPWLDAVRDEKAMSILTSAEQFWNAGQRRDPVVWRNWNN